MSHDELKMTIETEISKLEKNTVEIKEELKELEMLQERFDKASHKYSKAYDLLFGKIMDTKLRKGKNQL